MSACCAIVALNLNLLSYYLLQESHVPHCLCTIPLVMAARLILSHTPDEGIAEAALNFLVRNPKFYMVKMSLTA